MMYYLIFFTVLLLFICRVRPQFNFLPKDLKIEKYGPCPEYKSNAIQYEDFTILKQARNVYILNANINVTRPINSSLTFQINIAKCTLDLSQCDVYDTMSAKNFCERLTEKNALWSPLASNIKPPIKCPIQPVCSLPFELGLVLISNYNLKIPYRTVPNSKDHEILKCFNPFTLSFTQGYHRLINGTVDLTLILRLPVDGIRFVTYMKLLEEYSVAKSKKISRRSVLCLDSDVQFTATKIQRGKQNKKRTFVKL